VRGDGRSGEERIVKEGKVSRGRDDARGVQGEGRMSDEEGSKGKGVLSEFGLMGLVVF